jgi:predicted transposase YbfD/YdcC
MEILVIDTLKRIPDYRKGNAIRHVLSDILMIALLTIICNGNGYAAMRIFGVEHEEKLKEFLELPYGIPSQDTFEHVFEKLSPQTLSSTFLELVEDIKELALQRGRLLASIDGKTMRGSKDADGKAVHVVTAFASELRVVLGELATDKKSNEITAIPKLLEMFCQKGMVITIDAMGTQTEIAKTIIDKEADYVLSVKGNQKTLQTDVVLAMEEIEITSNSEIKSELREAGQYERTIEKGHGRIETRECYIDPNIGLLSTSGDWTGIAGFGMIVSKREEAGKLPIINREYFIYSLKDTTAKELLHIKRSHWAIENNLHWSLDVIFREDESRIRLVNAPENVNILRKQSMQLLKKENSFKASVSAKRYKCSLNLEYALKVVGVK